jgi:SagB-type dehydrogenase family enzyme
MKVNWSTSTLSSLNLRTEDRLCELYHENSKLFPELARQQAEGLTFSPFELYLASRGFRQYRNVPHMALPEMISSEVSLAEVMLRRRSRRDLAGAITLAELATILRQSLGPTAAIENEQYGVVQALRAWPSAGALYPLDTYILASKVDGLEPAVYHYNVITSELEQLSTRSPEAILYDAFLYQDFVVAGAVILLFVAVFERTLAKYGERGYRLVLLDAGHAAQNVLLTAEALTLEAVALGGFCDDCLAADLGIDGISEAVVHAVVIGRAS